MKPKITLIQMRVSSDKQENMKSAHSYIKRAASLESDIVILPEFFNAPYDMSTIHLYADETETIESLSHFAKESNVILIAGSFPESVDGKIYNTCCVFNETGALIGKHRKIHLFDVDIPGKIKFIESSKITAGDSSTIVETRFGKIGIGICFDLRFPELCAKAKQKGCNMMIYPAAFSVPTGDMHWEILLRSRAIDNQMFVIGCSSARNTEGYAAYGHSMVVDPMGRVVGKLGIEEGMMMNVVDLDQVEDTRRSIPLK